MKFAKKAPALEDEEFLKSLKIETIDELKEKVTEQIKYHRIENVNLKRKQITQIFWTPKTSSPPASGGRRVQSYFQNRVQQATRQGVKADDIEKNRDEWWKSPKLKEQESSSL